MTIWRPSLAGRTGPKFRQISDAIGESVADGRLTAGTRLPPQRDLAYALGVSLNTVSRAYADATDRGFVQGEVGRGTYVRAGGPLSAQAQPDGLTRPAEGPIDFSLNLPAPGRAAAALARTLKALSGSPALASFLDYQAAPDQPHHAAAAADWLGQVGLEARGEDIVITAGAQHGIMVALLATMRPGDVLLTEALTYAPIKAIAHHLGLKVYAVAGDDGMLDPDALDLACGRVAAKAVYCLPTLHTPTTATMDVDRRSAIAAIARKRGLTLIEDDVFGFLPPERPPPLAQFAPERTIYVTSVSKSLAPGLRVGYLRVPPERADAVRTAVRLSSWMPPPLMAEIASRWIEDGTADELTAFQREEAAARQSMARSLIPDRYLSGNAHGFHIWLTLPPQWRADMFQMAARDHGVQVVAGGAFAIDRSDGPNAIRLCLSHESSRARVHQGLAAIAELLRAPGPNDSMIL
ncbi:MAG: PLP-dependent aminotransferase family protein [Hyphomicrobiales bacterium]|nr:PLP-dependent aminotransferase family protein [Hyphomicrobiales bacterium]